MNEQFNLQGSIDLLRLKNSALVSIKGKICIVIPVEDADIYPTAKGDGTPKGAYLSLSILQSRAEDQYGNTHYVKPSISKEWKEKHTEQEYEEKKKTYLGNLKPLKFEAKQPTAQAIDVDELDGELPF